MRRDDRLLTQRSSRRLAMRAFLFLGCAAILIVSRQSIVTLGQVAGVHAVETGATTPVAAEVDHFGARGDGIADDTPAFVAADHRTRSAVIVPAGQFRITRDIAIAHRLIFQPGGSLALDQGATVQLSKTPEAAAVQRIFYGSGRVVIVAAGEPVYAEWWGARADAHSSSNQAFQAAEEALPNGGSISALAGIYVFDVGASDGLTITNKVNVYGRGVQQTIFRPEADAPHAMFTLAGSPNVGNLRDFQIAGSPLVPQHVVGIKSESAGISDISSVWIDGIGTGMQMIAANALDMDHIRIQSCAVTCMVLGGGTPGSQYFGDSKLQEVVLAPQTPIGLGLVIDGGTNALYATRVQIIGGITGLEIKNTVPQAQRPTNIWFWDSNFDAAIRDEVVLRAGWQIAFHNTVINGTTRGPGLVINADDSPSAVDGVWCDGCVIAGNAEDGIRWSSGENLKISDSRIDANGWSGPDTFAGVRVRAGAHCLFEMSGTMAGLDNARNHGWGNLYNPQGYGLILEKNALGDLRECEGRINVQGNVFSANRAGPILDQSSVPKARKLIANNLLE